MKEALQQLRGFEKIRLLPGEKKTVAFKLTPDHLALYNQPLERVVEAGEANAQNPLAPDLLSPPIRQPCARKRNWLGRDRS